MSELNVAVMPGDYIGPEIMEATLPTVERVAEIGGLDVKFVRLSISLEAYEQCGEHLPESTVASAKAADAILKGPVGGPPDSRLPAHRDIEEEAVIGFRKRLGLDINLRPINTKLSLIIPEISPIKEEFVSDTDLIVVRDLSGDVYNGQSGVDSSSGKEVYFERNDYTEEQVDRTVEAAIEIAELRGDKTITLMHKKNVLKNTGGLWSRRFALLASGRGFGLRYKHFDDGVQTIIGDSDELETIVTPNLVGDVISDATAKLMGSLGMGGAAEVGAQITAYTPIHGSAPFLERDTANPSGMLLSASMMFEGLGLTGLADITRQALGRVLDAGYLTPDLYARANRMRHISFKPKLVGTQKFGELVLAEVEKTAA
ncbi:MAG TPA: isocitrate/isopropylmalate family dehydrogenase [Candidatus Saccharimonadales bacterium]|nr:isocitrate/isopropylmalate family dehydrogenase [Candidatus Saccharimonadales bacterium]